MDTANQAGKEPGNSSPTPHHALQGHHIHSNSPMVAGLRGSGIPAPPGSPGHAAQALMGGLSHIEKLNMRLRARNSQAQ